MKIKLLVHNEIIEIVVGYLPFPHPIPSAPLKHLEALSVYRAQTLTTAEYQPSMHPSLSSPVSTQFIFCFYCLNSPCKASAGLIWDIWFKTIKKSSSWVDFQIEGFLTLFCIWTCVEERKKDLMVLSPIAQRRNQATSAPTLFIPKSQKQWYQFTSSIHRSLDPLTKAAPYLTSLPSPPLQRPKWQKMVIIAIKFPRGSVVSPVGCYSLPSIPVWKPAKVRPTFSDSPVRYALPASSAIKTGDSHCVESGSAREYMK